MADDDKQTAPPQSQAPASQAASAPPTPERREDDTPKWGRRTSDRPEVCPTCGVQVERGKLAAHRFHAHGEERRAAPHKDDGDGDGNKGDGDQSNTPPKHGARSDDKPAKSVAEKRRKGSDKSRWSDVRGGWG